MPERTRKVELVNNLYPLLVLCLVCGCGPESKSDAVRRMLNEAPIKAAVQCSNDVIGITRIIKVDFDSWMSAPKEKQTVAQWEPQFWKAEVTAEHVNAIGGIERTNLCYSFGIYHGDKREELMCFLDGGEMARRGHAAWLQEFERLHPGGLARYELTNAAAGR